MATSLYVSNVRLTAVCGACSSSRVNVKKFASIPLPLGAVLNGVITDEKLLTDALDALRGLIGSRLNTVRLVVSGGQILVKRASVPKLPAHKLATLIKNEFTDVDIDGDELLTDYRVLSQNGKDGGQTALLCGVRRSVVAQYDAFYKSAGVRLVGLDATADALSKLVRLLPDLRNDTFILLDLDGTALEATLYVQGEFRYQNRTRLMNERGTPESISEITRLVSSIIQFNTSERSGQSIAAVYLLGTDEQDTGLMNSLQTAFDIPSTPLSDAAGTIRVARGELPDLATYACAIGNLIE